MQGLKATTIGFLTIVLIVAGMAFSSYSGPTNDTTTICIDDAGWPPYSYEDPGVKGKPVGTTVDIASPGYSRPFANNPG